jgi:hypothetical protein
MFLQILLSALFGAIPSVAFAAVSAEALGSCSSSIAQFEQWGCVKKAEKFPDGGDRMDFSHCKVRADIHAASVLMGPIPKRNYVPAHFVCGTSLLTQENYSNSLKRSFTTPEKFDVEQDLQCLKENCTISITDKKGARLLCTGRRAKATERMKIQYEKCALNDKAHSVLRIDQLLFVTSGRMSVVEAMEVPPPPAHPINLDEIDDDTEHVHGDDESTGK